MLDKAELALDLTRSWLPKQHADGLARGVCRLFQAMDYAPMVEVPLASGRRVDVLAVSRRGIFAIAEIKSSLEDYRSDAKWREYLDYCDRFYFAVGVDFPLDTLPEDVGVILADRFGAERIREAPHSPMTSGYRRKQAVRFGRIAASRLRHLYEAEG